MMNKVSQRPLAVTARTKLMVIVAPVLLVICLLTQGGCSPFETATPDPSLAGRPTPIQSASLGGGTQTSETRPDGAMRLTTPSTDASDQNPAFSPAGTHLVFTRFSEGYNDGPAALFLLELSDDQPTRLTPQEDQDNVNLPGAAWNRLNDRILFASDRLESHDIWRIAPDGTDMSRITVHSGPPVYIEPSWSPDGQWVVFEASRAGSSEDGRVSEIWKVRADGTDLTPLTGESFDERQPNWSPEGDRILFQRRSLPDGQWDIYTITSDGTDLQNVTNSPTVDDTDASWSPRGRCVVYSSDNGELPVPNLFIIPAAGGQAARVTFSETQEDSAPSWSPRGEWVAFESRASGDESNPASLWWIGVPEGACDEESSLYLPLVLTVSPLPPLLAVNDFLYQLQNLDLPAIGDTAYDLVVMDYAAEGDDATAFSDTQIAALQDSSGGEKTVLAYMSIGEAEDYRFYWQEDWDAEGDGQPDPGAPAWLDVENPDWEGNYKVHYWDPAWQTVIFRYIDRLLEVGFDGAYLDIIDAYEYYADQGRAAASQEMVDFVAAIRAYARDRDPDFYILVQNAPELAHLVPSYLNSVDGIGQEDIYYGYEDDDVRTPPAVTTELENHLDLFKNTGKLVLTVDYATTPGHIDDAYARSLAKGYVPFATTRDLDQLTVNPGHEPD